MADLEEIGQHPSFRAPTNKEIRIWRYMDLAKYLALLQRRALFFTRATLLGDPFEGSSTIPMVVAREHIEKNRHSDHTLAQYKDMPDGISDQISKLVKSSVEKYMVSCWHMNEYESAAMWRLYLSANEGVCIQSTYNRLRSCLDKCIFIGEVNYIDYQTEWFFQGQLFNAIVHKRKSFEHERELRAVFWELHGIPEAEPYKAKIERAGLWIDIDLPSLIETVHISPAAEPWLVSVIQEATAKYDLHIPVVQSALTGSPLY